MTVAPTDVHVLVADDEPMNRLVAVESLQSLGVNIVAVASGREALDALLARPFDLLLLDVHMPDLSGIEVTEQVRRQELSAGTPRVPIVALTASATASDQAACLAAGMDAVLTKPYRIQDLEATVRQWCGLG